MKFVEFSLILGFHRKEFPFFYEITKPMSLLNAFFDRFRIYVVKQIVKKTCVDRIEMKINIL